MGSAAAKSTDCYCVSPSCMGNLKEGLATQTTTAAYSSSGVIYSGYSGSPDVGGFFFPPHFFSQSELKGKEGSSLTKRSSLCQRPDVFVTYDKAPLRNMIALVKRTNYSPLTTFQTHFYWSIQPNKTLLHWQKGMPSFLHIFSKPRVYMIPVITPL